MASNVETLEMDIVGNLSTQGPKNVKILNDLKKSGDAVADNAGGKWAGAFGKLEDSAKSSAKKALGPLGDIVDELPAGFGSAALAVGGTVAVLGAAAYATKKLIDSMAPLQEAQRVFQFKDAKNGLAVLARIRQLGSDAGFGLEDTTAAATKLGATFNNTASAEKAFKTISDLKALVPTVGLGQLTDEFVELRSKAAVGGSDLEKFKKILGSAAPTFDQLALAAGTSINEAEESIKNGTYSAEKFADALGIAAKQAAGTSEQGQAALKLSTANPQAQINKLADSFTFLKEAFGSALLGPDGGAGALGTLAASIKAVASNPQVIGFVKGLGSAIAVVAKFGAAAAEIYLKLYASALQPLAPVIKQIGDLFSSFGGTGNSLLPILTAIFQVGLFPLRVAITAVSVSLQAIIGVVNTVIGVWQGFNNLLGGIPAQMFDVGVAIINGLINGISSLASAPVDALKKIGLDAIAGVKNILGIASPSKVFADIGENTAIGMSDGLDSGSSDVSASATNLATSTMDSGTPTLPPGGVGTAGGNNTITIAPVITVQGGATPQAIQQIQKSVIDAVITALKQAQLGGTFA